MSFPLLLGLKNAARSWLRLLSGAFLLAIGLLTVCITVNVLTEGRREAAALKEQLRARTLVKVSMPYDENYYINWLTREQIESIIKQVPEIESVWLYEGSSAFNYLLEGLGENGEDIILGGNDVIGMDATLFEPFFLNRESETKEGAFIPVTVRERIEGKELLLQSPYWLNGEEKVLKRSIPILGSFEDTAPVPLASENDAEKKYRIILTKELFYDIRNELYTLLQAEEWINTAGDVLLKPENLEQIDAVTERIKALGFSAVTTDYSAQSYYAFLADFERFGLIIAALFTVLSSIIVLQSVEKGLRKREKTIGVMRVLGYSWRSLGIMITSEMFLCFFAALLLSITAGLLLEKPVAVLLSNMFDKISYRHQWYGTAASALLAAGLLVVYTIIFMCRWKQKSLTGMLRETNT